MPLQTRHLAFKFTDKENLFHSPFLRLLVLIGYLVVGLGVGLMGTSCKKSSDGESATRQVQKFHCPMHPEYVADQPGDCPICHMRLVPMEESPQLPTESSSPKEKKILYYRNPMNPKMTSAVPTKDEMGMDFIPVYEEEVDAALPVSGQATVRMSDTKRQLIGVETMEVKKQPLMRDLRAAAQVAYDPELYNAIREYQEMRKNKGEMDFRSMERAAELKLEQMGIFGKLLEEVAQQDFDGGFLLTAAPDKRVWIYVDIYADEVAWVRPGQLVELTSPTFPGRQWKGRVLSIDRVINKDTRTLRARVETMNVGGLLRPELFMNAILKADLGLRVAVPTSALLRTGKRTLAYVETKPGEFEPREVQAGAEGEDYTEVLSGLTPGEKVVVSANFLIDSESKIKGAIK
ncbi:MAG: hypothetical protein KCHDKBKB_02343 [Elusimicrobia bacterium]|nr:hypothetical protein [Elusimicrobiota bacterium]